MGTLMNGMVGQVGTWMVIGGLMNGWVNRWMGEFVSEWVTDEPMDGRWMNG